MIQLSMLSHFVRCTHSYRSIHTFASFDMNMCIERCEVTKVTVSDNKRNYIMFLMRFSHD